VPADWKKYIAVGVMVIFFNLSWHFGSVLGAGTAAIQGTFYASFNIFMLRGFFPDGRTPEMGHMSTPSVIGWLDLALFNMFFLSTDMRMGVKMFALANNTYFMLCFLNPQDQTVFSKNFKFNPDGTAVNAVKVAILSSIFARCLTVLLFQWLNASSEDWIVCSVSFEPRLGKAAIGRFRRPKWSVEGL
jgi:hypothetical protein